MGDRERHATLRCLDEIESMKDDFHFGKELAETVIQRFSSLHYRLHYNFPPHPQDRALSIKCKDLHTVFKEWLQWDVLTWISNHEIIRMQLIASLRNTKPYRMGESDISAWTSGIVECVKQLLAGRRWKGKKNEQRRRTEGQICADVLSTLANHLDGSDPVLSRSGTLEVLVDLCQKTKVIPTFFNAWKEKDNIKIDNSRPACVNGASAIVYQGVMGDKEIAVKQLRLHANTRQGVQKRFVRELLILQSLCHPCIVPFLGAINEESTGRFWIISEWMRYGDIMSYLNKEPQAPRKDLIEQVADGLHFLNYRKIVHGDLKGANILINEHRKACIADFGLSSVYAHSATSLVSATSVSVMECRNALRARSMPESLGTTLASVLSTMSGDGTWRWMSPERLFPEMYGRKSAAPTFESDVFAFGMLTYQVYSGQVPFYEHNDCNAILHVVEGGRPSQPLNAPNELWVLVEECWTAEPSQRPNIWDVYNRLAVMDVF